MPYALLLGVLFAAGQFSAPPEPVVYYVATTGSDSNPGSDASPFATIQRAVDASRPGDTILVRDGVYGPAGCYSKSSFAVNIARAGSESAYISIRAENPHGAVLDAQSLCHSYFNLAHQAAYISISGFVITGSYWSAIWSNQGAHHIRITGNRIEFIGNRTETSAYGIAGIYTGAGSGDFLIEGNVIHDIGRTGGAWLWHDHGLYIHGCNYVVANNVFYNLKSGWAITPVGPLSNVLITNNTFAFPNPIRDGHIAVGEGDVSGLVIRNNIFYQPRGAAVVTCAAHYSGENIVENNMVFGADSVLGGEICGSSSGFTSLRIRNNTLNDPAFVNAAAPPFDFTLQPGSPAIDAGVPDDAIAADALGTSRPQGAALDLGAYEYVPPLGARLRRLPAVAPRAAALSRPVR